MGNLTQKRGKERIRFVNNRYILKHGCHEKKYYTDSANTVKYNLSQDTVFDYMPMNGINRKRYFYQWYF